MNSELVPVKSLESFRLSHLIKVETATTPTQKAVTELFACFDELLLKTPIDFRDFLLRYLRSCGLPIDYDGLPFWAERAARHVFTLLYPTLRKSDLTNPTPEDFGKVSGHLLAMIAHSKADGPVFQRLPRETAAELRDFFAKIEPPLRVLIDDGLHLPMREQEAFLRGMNHAFSRTFDVIGYPQGWNTNSPVLLAICLGWRFIVTKSPPLSTLHKQLAAIFGKQEVGSQDRVKKICHRIGLRFSGDRAAGRQGTTEILSVTTQVQTTDDK